ncbi:MAG: MFS transporter [Novosphingobium sp.]|nr:MFS transporter [Novosphingobium sp.]
MPQDLNELEPVGRFAPLRERSFRNIWMASVFANFAQLFLGVGAAWQMTQMTGSPSMVALVQTAMMLPMVLVSLPAGAIADMYDKRKVAIAGLIVSTAFAACLAVLGFIDVLSPWILLAFCSLIGAGVALYGPSWQSSIPEQVSLRNLPAAIGLGTISYNVARSFGPALGGLIVLAAGAKAVFALTAVLYWPLLLAFTMWKRKHVPSRLPPERMDRAIIGGARYAIHSPPIRTSFVRAFMYTLTSASATALAPLVAKDLLGGDAATYGLLLGVTGVGALVGALNVSTVRDRFSTEGTVRLLAVATGLPLIVIAMSTSVLLTCAAYFMIGLANILSVALLNINVQLSAPRWVAARALSLFGSSLTAGVALGAWAWGMFGSAIGVTNAYFVSGSVTLLTALIGYLLPLSRDEEGEKDTVDIGFEPNLDLGLSIRSGPIVVEIDYRVDPERARDFYAVMMRMQRMRKRIGGFEWSISRDIEDQWVWTERYHCPTWGDYLRMRDRYTQMDFDVQAEARSFDETPGGIVVRRRLERPYGSVRWKADSPDPHQDTMTYIGP